MIGVDVSNNQGAINWTALANDGVRFAWIKATEGATWTDPLFAENMRRAQEAGIRVGAYHYARPDNNSPQKEAWHFLDRARPRPGDLLPVLDFEAPEASRLGATKQEQWAATWLNQVWGDIGVKPIFYSYPAYIFGPLGGGQHLRSYPLWLASYGPNDGSRHISVVPYGFNMVVHQYTSRGNRGGRRPLDLNFLLVPLDTITYHPTPRATLRKRILARHRAGWGWGKIKATAAWREFKLRGGS